MAALAIVTAAMGVTQALQGAAANRQADENADLLRKLGVVEAGEVRREVAKLQGAQIAAMAASGGDPSQGSFLDIQAETAAEGELRALRSKFGFESRATTQEAVGRSALASGITSGAGTILGGSLSALGQNPPRTTTATAPRSGGVTGGRGTIATRGGR